MKQLDLIRRKIIDAIRYSKRFWLISKENTFGLATIINLVYKRSYVEVLFFPNIDVMQKGVPLLKVNTPIETEVDFNNIVLNPDFDDDSLVSPAKIIQRINHAIDIEYKHHLNLLDKEIELLSGSFENFQINRIPYFREIFIHFPDFIISFKINFENYPRAPKLLFSEMLSKIITISEFLKRPIMNKWNELNPPHIVDIVKAIVNLIVKRLKIRELFKDSQNLILDKVTINENIRNVSFKISRGESLGIYYNSDNLDNHKEILKLFNTIKYENKAFSGKIKIFGKYIQLLKTGEFKNLLILPQTIDSKINSMKVKKGIKYNLDITPHLEDKNKILKERLKNEGLFSITEEWKEKEPFWRLMMKIEEFKEKKKLIEDILRITGLYNKRNKKFSELTHLEYFLFLLGRSVLQNPLLIMFSIPEKLLNRLQYERFISHINKIKKLFHIPLIIHGPQEIISNCDKVLTITKNLTLSGTIKDLREKIPQHGEVLTIELDNPNKEELTKMFSIKSIVIKEERKYEKYKIFPKKDPNEVIERLIEIFGVNLYNFRRSRASLSEYTEFLNLQPHMKIK